MSGNPTNREFTVWAAERRYCTGGFPSSGGMCTEGFRSRLSISIFSQATVHALSTEKSSGLAEENPCVTEDPSEEVLAASGTWEAAQTRRREQVQSSPQESCREPKVSACE